MNPRRSTAFVLSGLMSILASAPGAADDRLWALCDTPEPTPIGLEPPESDEPDAVRFSADRGWLDPSATSQFEGDVVVGHRSTVLRADSVLFDHEAQWLEGQGDIQLVDDDFSIAADYIHLDLETNQTELQGTEYRFLPRHAHGQAKRILREGPEYTRLERVTYSTCDLDQVDWLLSAERVELDQVEGEGTARNAVLRFKNVPILYSPIASFPIDDRRKSGFLAPTAGTSSNAGFNVEVPYYFNIAPNYDATLTPRYMADRGLQLKGEFRYLKPKYEGQLEAEYLPEDRENNKERHLIKFDHLWRPIQRVRADVKYEDVSDNRYFDDLGSSLQVSSRSFLEQRIDVDYAGDYLSVLARAHKFETIDRNLAKDEFPYDRLPQVQFKLRPPTRPGFAWGLYGEAVWFDRTVGPDGRRLDVMPELGYIIDRPGYFFRPRVKYRYTSYELDDLLPGEAKSPDRDLPTASLDSGLIFERRFGRDLRYTIEPRLFYLYTPFEEQDDIPLFDTDLSDFNFDILFSDNRFDGSDRVGDANQLSLALSTRLLSRSGGDELLGLSLGQILYFRDRKVTLPGEPIQDSDSSDLVVQLNSRPSKRWLLRGAYQWDPDRDRTDLVAGQVQYRRSSEKVLNVGYRQRRDPTGVRVVNQSDLSFGWPLTRKWKAVGRWTYSFLDEDPIGVLGGLEYESCCWAIRAVGRRYVTQDIGQYNTNFYVQFVFKGLANLGQGVDELLEREIRGYEVFE
jgi:LPS-assembly protein